MLLIAKQGEISYLKNLGADGQDHAFNKPFSDLNCGQYFLDIGAIVKLISNPPAKILDLGVGTGWTSCFYALNGYTVVAQDIAPDMIALAQENRRRYSVESRLDLIVSDYENLPSGQEFDVAIFYDCLHHCEDELQALSAVCRALKPGGLLITAEPGLGHSASSASIEAMRKYGVNERDMPPKLIVEKGLQAGFSSYQVYRRLFAPDCLSETSIKQTMLLLLRSLKNRLAKNNLCPPYMNDSHFAVLVK